MFAEIIDLLLSPEKHEFVHLDGEVYIEPIIVPSRLPSHLRLERRHARLDQHVAVAG